VAPETMVLFYRMTGELSTFLTIFRQKSFGRCQEENGQMTKNIKL